MAPSSVSFHSARSDVAMRAAVCKGFLFAASELVLHGGYGTPVDRLVARANEAIDDIDDVLVALDPVRDAQAFMLAASLQRELEELQVSIAQRRRTRS